MPSTQDIDATLLKKAAKGDSKAFEKLYDRLSAPLYAFTLQLCSDKHLAAQIFQHSFIHLWQSSSSYQPEFHGSAFAWIFSTFRQHALHQMQAAHLKPTATLTPADQHSFFPTTPASTVTEEEHEVNYHDHAALLRNSLQLLPPPQRRSIEYALLTGESPEAIADKLGIPNAEIRTHLQRGLQRLHGLIQQGESA